MKTMYIDGNAKVGEAKVYQCRICKDNKDTVIEESVVEELQELMSEAGLEGSISECVRSLIKNNEILSEKYAEVRDELNELKKKSGYLFTMSNLLSVAENIFKNGTDHAYKADAWLEAFNDFKEKMNEDKSLE